MAKFVLPKKFVSQYPHKFGQGKKRYLRGERILPPPLTGRETVVELMDRAFLAYNGCLLYTSDAADDLHCVNLGGRRIFKKKKKK